MRQILAVFAGLFLLTNLCFAAEGVDLTNESAQLSYSVGFQVGGDFKRQGIDIDPEIVLQGIMDAMGDKEPSMTQEEMRDTLVALQRSVYEAQQKSMEDAAEKNLDAGRTFLAENGKKEGVITTDSGLQYKVLVEGSGKSPAATDMVEVNYRGTLIDGTEFDSSYSRGAPAQFKADQVIKGWTEALQLMKEGGKLQLFIPAELAYGNRGMGPIGPNSTLIFEVELLKVL